MHDTAMEIGKAFFDTYLKTDTSLTIVDVGAQDVNGSLRSVAPPHHNYIGLDFVDGKGVDVVITDPYNLPLESNSVDVVVCSSCFEHSEFFWLLFIEIQRILKPDGLFYLNAPSNGMFHRYPVDCWRFYPDSGIALQNWGRKNGYNTALLESFTGKQKQGVWNDFVAVFLKDSQFVEKHPDRIQTIYSDVTNGLLYGDQDFTNFADQPEDRLVYIYNHQLKSDLETSKTEIIQRRQTIENLKDELSLKDKSLETSKNEIEKLNHQYQALIDYVHQKNVDLRTAESIFKKMYKNRLRKYALRLLLGKKMTRRISEWLRNTNFNTKQG
jgi:SAM-dependent methyltransferase